MILRAVIYARCSTEEESQKDALRKQVDEGRSCVRENGWILADIYVESRSGTTTKGRSEYNRLYEDLSSGRFDIIVIKSQDRLMRNTKDWYLFVDRLLTEQKKLYIYIERKFYTTDDALITGIKAILAEEYSRELSKKINNAHRNRQKQNGPVVLTSNTYGYRKMPDKSVVIIEEEAQIKRRMYELCAAGFGSRTISAILKKEGIAARNGRPFTDSAILRMIHNPLNKGTAVMNRLHYDFASKRVIKMPEDEQYVYENKVPPIVSEELWEAANREILRRAEIIQKEGTKGEKKRGRNRGRSRLSGKLFCGLCKSPYYRRTRRRYRDKAVIYEWKCKKYLETGRNDDAVKSPHPQIKGGALMDAEGCGNVHLDAEGCGNVHLDEERLYKLLREAGEKRYQPDREEIIGNMVNVLKNVLKEQDYQPELDRENRRKEKLQEQMEVLIEKLLDGIISDEIYQRKQHELERALAEVKDRVKELEQRRIKGCARKDRLVQIERTLKEGSAVEKAVSAEMLEEVEKIWIYPGHMEIVFSLSGITGMDNLDRETDGCKNTMKIEYGNLFDYKARKKEERDGIVEIMRADPKITAREIAGKLGISLSGANYRIRVLKKAGRIRFKGRGGKGEWEILA